MHIHTLHTHGLLPSLMGQGQRSHASYRTCSRPETNVNSNGCCHKMPCKPRIKPISGWNIRAPMHYAATHFSTQLRVSMLQHQLTLWWKLTSLRVLEGMQHLCHLEATGMREATRPQELVHTLRAPYFKGTVHRVQPM
jgi:hypothetical protein